MPEEAGVEIYGRFYPWPTSFTMGDPVLVKEVTGMRWPAFVTALDELDPDEPADQVVIAGLISVAFWHGNPTMSRDKVRRVIEGLPQEQVEILDGDEGDASPPAQEAPSSDGPSTTSSPSDDSPEDGDETATPAAST